MVVPRVVQGVAAVTHDQILRQNLGMQNPNGPQIVGIGPTIPGTGGRRAALIRGFAQR